MKRIFRLPLFLAISTLFILGTACHKEHSTTGNGDSGVTVLTQAPWKYDTAGADLNMDGTIDVGDSTLPACFKDNTYIFNKDSTGVMDEGATICNAGDPQTFNFTWSLSGSNPQVLRSNADPILESGLKVYALTSTQFKLYKDTSYFGVNFYYIISLKH